MKDPLYPFSKEAIVVVRAPPEQVFVFADDHSRFSGHMNSRSLMMGGGRMVTETDDWHGQAVGSRIRMSGTIWGLRLHLEEVVTERVVPTRKVWRTVGTPRLLIIGPYEMGVEITPLPQGSRLRVFLNYALPGNGMGGWMRRRLAEFYANWCTRRMANDAVRQWADVSSP